MWCGIEDWAGEAGGVDGSTLEQLPIGLPQSAAFAGQYVP